MANERAPGVSFIYAVQTWRQLAAVAEPARGCGRILIIASAGVEPRRGRRNRHHPVGAVTVSSSSPTAKVPRWSACSRHRAHDRRHAGRSPRSRGGHAGGRPARRSPEAVFAPTPALMPWRYR
jgi:hypothetical protein